MTETVAQDAAVVGVKGLELMVEAVEKDAPMERGADVPVHGIDAILINNSNASEFLK